MVCSKVVGASVASAREEVTFPNCSNGNAQTAATPANAAKNWRRLNPDNRITPSVDYVVVLTVFSSLECKHSILIQHTELM